LTLSNGIKDENVAIKQDLMKSNGLYVFLNSFGDLCIFYKYNIIEENKPFCLLHNLLCMDIIFIFTFYFIFVIIWNFLHLLYYLWKNCNFHIYFFKEQKIVKENAYSLGIFKIKKFCDIKISKFINYFTKTC